MSMSFFLNILTPINVKIYCITADLSLFIATQSWPQKLSLFVQEIKQLFQRITEDLTFRTAYIYRDSALAEGIEVNP